MDISSEKPYTIFRKEYNDRTFYKVGLSKKTKEGEYEKGYVDIRFKGNPSIPNKTQIYIKKAFLSFYLNKDKHTTPYIQVMEWEEVAEVIEKEHADAKKDKDNDDLFAEFGEEHKDDEFVLPF